MKIMIVDIDGTICDPELRRTLAAYTNGKNKTKINWNVFNNPAIIHSKDVIRHDIINMANKIKEDNDCLMYLFSGRDAGYDHDVFDDCSNILNSLNILDPIPSDTAIINKFMAEVVYKRHGLNFDKIMMRPHGNYTPDDDLKESWLKELNIDVKNIVCCIDDRPRVVARWKALGIKVIDVNLYPERGFW